jgi:hypothetical protein
MVEGIEKDKLEIKFRLDIYGVEYGFKGEVQGEKIRVVIPPMGTILQEGTTGIFRGKLRVIGDGKYYMKPWEDDVEIKTEPKVVTQLAALVDAVTEERNVRVKAYLASEAPPMIVEKKTPKKENPNPNKSLRSKLS